MLVNTTQIPPIVVCICRYLLVLAFASDEGGSAADRDDEWAYSRGCEFTKQSASGEEI